MLTLAPGAGVNLFRMYLMNKDTITEKTVALLKKAAAPVAGNPAFFVLLFTMLFLPETLYLLCKLGEFPDLQLTSGVLLCYLLTLPLMIRNRVFRLVYEYLLMTLALMVLMMNLYMLYVYGEAVNYLHTDTVAALRASNPDEIREYLSTYITGGVVLAGIAIFAALLLLFSFLRRFSFASGLCSGLVVVAFMSFSSIMTVVNWDRITALQIFWIFKEADLPDLNEYRQNPELVLSDDAPENIVLIVGESFSRSNSSLYGYGKSTNPMLESLAESGDLNVFGNVMSYTTTTIPSFKAMMMSYRDEYSDSIEWYECLTLIEVMQKAGYKAHWISNQSKRGICDNEVGLFAEMCDDEAFAGDKLSGMKRVTYDEELLPLIGNSVRNSGGKNFYIVHLMGSHSKFSSRYPAGYSRFSAADYADSHQQVSSANRQLLAEYDNSILYNDRVVHDIMMQFADKDAVVVYLSDHGIDVFYSSDDYIGHAIKGDSVSMQSSREIPFVVYTTETFRKGHPALQKKICRSLGNSMVTDWLMYTIIDLAGVETVNGVSYKERSLLK